MKNYLGIEIGGTKLQLGISGGGEATITEMRREKICPEDGAEGILAQIKRIGGELATDYELSGVGIGFGGPVDLEKGQIVKSHHVSGWDGFPIVDWTRDQFGDIPVGLINDSDSAGLAEARLGAGRGAKVVYYSNAGSGVGGALIIDGQLYRGGTGMAIEPGHLRYSLESESPQQSVESLASGWGITSGVRSRLDDTAESKEILDRCQGDPQLLDTRMIAESALAGNRLAIEAFDISARAFGWAIAQAVTLIAPNRVVLGGGVSLADPSLFLEPVRKYAALYVFPPFADRFEIVLAELGEDVVVHGAICTVS
jgi:glucokinase